MVKEKIIYYPCFEWSGIYDPDINMVLETVGANKYIGTYIDREPLANRNGYYGYNSFTFHEIDRNLVTLAREGKLIKERLVE